MLDSVDSQRVQKLFDASQVQVDRDHAISHVLAALQRVRTQFVFFGGTALSRTFLTAGRLSEDIDLYSADRRSLCRELDELPGLIKEEFPRTAWNVMPSQTVDPQSSLLVCDSSTQIKVQAVDSVFRGWANVPIVLTSIHQRFSDVPATNLFTPTFDGFVAMKALVWFDRRLARDLFDLEALSHKGDVTEGARELVKQLRGFRLSKQMMAGQMVGRWYEELAHQTRLEKTEEQCLAQVLDWWAGSDD